MITQLVSIIIPTFNRGDLLIETLESVKNQTIKDWECLIVDDGSDDNTFEVIEEFIEEDRRFKYFKRPENKIKGANACRNYGFQQSLGAYINWLDSDDLLHSEHLETHLDLHSNNIIDVSISMAGLFKNRKGDLKGIWADIRPDENEIDEMIAGKISWGTPCCLWNRKCLPNSPFIERLQCSQEWTFNLSMLIKGVKFKILETETVSVRRHDDRIGKSQSPNKFYSELDSRVIIHKKLRDKVILSDQNDFYLMRNILQGLKKTTRTGDVKFIYFEFRLLMKIFRYTKYQKTILKAMLFGVPIYFLFRKGEILFKL